MDFTGRRRIQSSAHDENLHTLGPSIAAWQQHLPWHFREGDRDRAGVLCRGWEESMEA